MVAVPDIRFVVRAEYDEWRLLEEHPELYDAVLIKSAYLAPYHEEHPHRGRDPRRLARAVPHGRELWYDPDTAGLFSRTSAKLPEISRICSTPLAHELGLPIDLSVLASSSQLRDRAVDLSLEDQVGSATLIPPYADVDSPDGTALRLNLAMLRRAVAVAGDEVVTAVIQMTRYRLLSGLLADVASAYAATGVRRVLIRVRGLKSEAAERDELIAYLDAVEAHCEHELETFPDCVGLLGPVFVAEHASGFTTGTQFFQSVPEALLSVGGGGGGKPIGVRDPGTWETHPREAGVNAFDARVAGLSTLREHALLAARDPDALIASLRSAGGYPAIWAGVLAERHRRAA
jgi:hypothetical protein